MLQEKGLEEIHAIKAHCGACSGSLRAGVQAHGRTGARLTSCDDGALPPTPVTCLLHSRLGTLRQSRALFWLYWCLAWSEKKQGPPCGYHRDQRASPVSILPQNSLEALRCRSMLVRMSHLVMALGGQRRDNCPLEDRTLKGGLNTFF